MARIEDLVCYVGTVTAVTGAVAVALSTSAPQMSAEADRAQSSRMVLTGEPRSRVAMPEQYRRELLNSLAACFDPANPPSQQMMDEVNSLYMLVDRYNLANRWSSTASGGTGSQGDPITLLWSFAPDGLSIPNGVGEGAANNELFARMDALFAGVGGRATWVQQFTRCFARWEALSGVGYLRVTVGGNDWDDGAVWTASGAAGLRGDVRISMKNIDAVNGILAYNTFPGTGAGGNMVIDRSESWQTGSTGNTPFRFLRNTVMHEHGHGLGFNHTCSNNSGVLMEPFLSTSFDGPQQDDIRAVQRHYGDPFEPNNNAGAAPNVATLGSTGTTTIGTIPTSVLPDTIIYPSVANASLVSIDANGESDFWKVSTTSNILANITLTPVGSTYDDSDQQADGSCPAAASNINSVAISDLTLRVTNSTGTTTLAFENSTLVGLAESVPSMLLSGSDTYALVVAEADTPAQTQSYRVDIQVLGATSVRASDATSSTDIGLTWTNIPGATGYQVFRSATNNFASAVQIGAPATNAYTDPGLPGGSTFFYWVKATQSFGGFTNSQFVGNDQGSTSLPPNNPPTANAGPDQSVRDPEGDGIQSVTLNGSGSSDSDGTITSYVWKEGVATIATGVNPSLNLSAGVHTIVLTVTDDDTATATDTVVVTVTSNNAPIANAGDDVTVIDANDSGAEIVNLSSAGSSDADGSIVLYRWTEGLTEIATGNNPPVEFAVGVHTVELTVTDNEGRTATDTVVITVEAPSVTCLADFNGDGFLDFFDYDDYVNCYEDGICLPGTDADFNGDGFVDFFDYDDYVTAFEQGC